MTRDGRPSRIKDIRLFYDNDREWLDHQEAVSFARRLAWWLNGEDFGIGHDPSLYISFDPGLGQGRITAEPPEFTPDDWWFRRVGVGTPADFPSTAATDVATRGVIDALKFLKPDDADLIDGAAQTVLDAGSDCHFLLKVKEYAKETVEVSTTIGTWPGPSRLYAALIDKETGQYRQAPPAELRFYDDGVLLAGKVKISRRSIDLAPRQSTPARLIADRHAGGPIWHIDDFVPAARPVMSSMLKFR